MSGVPVTKMHGTYNDFVVLDNRLARIANLCGFARLACNRRAALGADGLLVIETSDTCDARMLIFNADGSEAEMCGNGIRCVARYLAEAGEGDLRTIETIAGPIQTQVLWREPEFVIRATLGTPQLQSRFLPFEHAQFVIMGNPHVVIFDESSLDDVDLPAMAATLQEMDDFPDGTNVHVAQKTGSHGLRVRHWERGVGLTQSCGTGAVSCAVAAISMGMVESPVDVAVPGGNLIVEWSGTGPASMTGPAVRAFDGNLLVDDALVGT
jgi:diaminopimelate epimerase